MVKILRRIWDGIIEFEDDDASYDVKAFNSFGKSALVWFQYSRELYRAATYIVEERERKWNEITHLFQAPIALMLGAYAIETLLKMVVIAEYCEQHGLKFESRNARDFVPKSHDLLALAQKANLRVNEADKRLLKELSRYSTWAGRYPIPLTAAGYSGPALREAIAPAPKPLAREHPTWPKFVALYVKLHALSVRKTFKGQGVILKPKPKNAQRALGPGE